MFEVGEIKNAVFAFRPDKSSLLNGYLGHQAFVPLRTSFFILFFALF